MAFLLIKERSGRLNAARPWRVGHDDSRRYPDTVAGLTGDEIRQRENRQMVVNRLSGLLSKHADWTVCILAPMEKSVLERQNRLASYRSCASSGEEAYRLWKRSKPVGIRTQNHDDGAGRGRHYRKSALATAMMSGRRRHRLNAETAKECCRRRSV